MRSAAVICVLIVLPAAVWGYSKAAPRFARAAAGSAGLAMGDFDVFIYNGESSSAAEVQGFEPLSSVRRYEWDMDMAPQETETPAKSSEIPAPKPSAEIISALPYPEEMEGYGGVIEKYHYGEYDGDQYFDLAQGGQVRNCTEIANDVLISESGKAYDFEIDADSDEPQILIYHTHTTESFEPRDRDFYDPAFTCKTTDPEKNITAVGDEICRQLDEAGIAYIHDTLVHDYPSYDGAYDSSRATVQDILAQYPSIKVALDIHRDGIEREDGTRLSPVAEIDGKEAAQIMIISCCDDGSGDLPEYMKNFHFACALQSTAENMFSGLTRPILFDYRFYNQDLTAGSLLIEVGSHGNSLEQVKYSGELIGKALVEMFG